MVKVLQANLYHNAVASVVVERWFAGGKVDVALIIELLNPWVNRSNILGLNATGKLIYNTGESRPRKCIFCNKNINLLPIREFCTDDMVAALFSLRNNSEARIVIC